MLASLTDKKDGRDGSVALGKHQTKTSTVTITDSNNNSSTSTTEPRFFSSRLVFWIRVGLGWDGMR